MKFSVACLILLSLKSTDAWVPTITRQQPTFQKSIVGGITSSSASTTQRYASVEEKVDVIPVTEEGTVALGESSSASVMNPEYTAAYEQTVAVLKAKLPEKYHGSMIPLLSHFAKEYLVAAQMSHADRPEDDFTLPMVTMERFVKGAALGLQFGVPSSPDFYTFDVSHTALRGDQLGYNRIDYYAYGNNFFRHCMDFSVENPVETHVLGSDNLQKALDQIKKGENVVFLANHQSEADPQVVSCCFELCGEAASQAASQMIYIAGHKVTTDVLAIPFSMGRNLICIHSKKHIDSDKETKPIKQRQNLKAMNALLRKLKDGGSMVWVAPSGGRDRRDLSTGKVPIAPFDSKTIDMFRLMGNKSGVPTHYYTMAMVSYELCPPPDNLEAATGEQRNVRYSPVGIKIGNELESVGGLETRHDFCDTAMEQCIEDYNELDSTLALYAASKK